METEYLAGLNIQQRSAVLYGTGQESSGPLLIIAGAGTGKTTTLAHRVAHLIATGADARRILLLAFTRRAAEELRCRVTQIIGRTVGGGVDLPWTGTFHSVGIRMLRSCAASIRLDLPFTIIDQEDATALMGQARKELHLASSDLLFPNDATCLAIYSRSLNGEAELDELLGNVFPGCSARTEELCALFTTYVQAKRQLSLWDYDDIVLYWARALSIPEVAAKASARFDHVLVDEYQDTSRLQASILSGLKPDGTGLTVVGDDAQAIYSFRGASSFNIIEFPEKFQPPAELITLERNYRSTKPLIEASNAVIGLAERTREKHLWSERASHQKPVLVAVGDEREQALYVAERISQNRDYGLPLGSQAVLFRASHDSIRLEGELEGRKIPFRKFGGGPRPTKPLVKDVLAVLRWATNLHDTLAGYRVLNVMPGFGPKQARRILQAVRSSPLPLTALEELEPPGQAEQGWLDFLLLLRTLRFALGGWPQELQAVRDWYEPLIHAKSEGLAPSFKELDRLQEVASVYLSRAAFLTELALDSPDHQSDDAGNSPDDDRVVLSTIHSAKGLEWPIVFVLNVIDGSIPSDLATRCSVEMEEQRRLLYVAMTRAKDELHLVQPLRLIANGRASDKPVGDVLCRFIPEDLLQFFEHKVFQRSLSPLEPYHEKAGGLAMRDYD